MDHPTLLSGTLAYGQALQYRALGMLPQAAEACRAALRQNPRHVGALRVLAELAAGSGNIPQALELLTQAIRAEPWDSLLYGELGRLQIALRRPADAVYSLRRALEIDPALISAQNTLGIALRDLGRLDEAESAHRTALELNPLYAPAHQSLGDLFRDWGEFEGARLCFETALQLDPSLVQARIGLGNTLLDQGEFQAAVDEYRGAIATGQTVRAIYISLGTALKELGDAEGSLEAFRQAVTGNPNSWEAHLSLGSAFLDFGQFTGALASLREAIRLRGDVAVAHVLYGTAQAALGDFEGALSSVERGLPPQSTRQQVFAALASKLLSIGLEEQALVCFKKQLEYEPEDVGAQHFVTALSGQNPDHPAESYVRNLFDQFAGTFDRHLLAALGYTIPRDLIDALLAAGSPNPPWDVLDLGCGTGLVGREIAPHARSLIGIDLSPKMIGRAAESGLYTQLKVADLGAALNAEPANHYDVVTAADVFLYVGKLDSVVSAARRVLRSGGMFAFSVEAAERNPSAMRADGLGYQLMPTGRYVHFESYLRSLALRNAFEIKLFRAIRVRTEHRRPVMGWITVWTCNSPAS